MADSREYRGLTNTKTSVKEIKTRLGILGDPQGEDEWAQFNRASKLVYENHLHQVDVNKTWLELGYALRRHLIVTAYAQYPDRWRARYHARLLEDICNTRLFRLHHLSRLKSNGSRGSRRAREAWLDDEDDSEEWSSIESASPVRRPLPFDPVRQVN